MKSSIYLLSAFVLIVSLSNCNKENTQEIEEELQIHFDNFVAEANERGVTINLDEMDIGGYVENILSRGTLGQCKTYSNGSHSVVIDQDYWNRASDLDREYVVFHELGHCILDRDHDDTSDALGNCMSIMQSGDNNCQGDYRESNRAQLLIELFTN